MPSLEKRVAQQRDILIARGAGIRLHGKRVHMRLRHPAVLIPAFVAGFLVGRAVPVLQTLPEVTARLRHVTDELGRLHAMVQVLAALVPAILGPAVVEVDDDASTPSG